MEKLNLSLAALLLLSCVGITFSMTPPLTEEEKSALGHLQRYREMKAELDSKNNSAIENHNLKKEQLEYGHYNEVMPILGNMQLARKECEEKTGINLRNVDIRQVDLISLIMKSRRLKRSKQLCESKL